MGACSSKWAYRLSLLVFPGWPYTLDEILARDKVSLDLFWLRDESLEDSANLPDLHVLAEEIADDLRSALEQIESVLGDLNARAAANEGRVEQ